MAGNAVFLAAARHAGLRQAGSQQAWSQRAWLQRAWSPRASAIGVALLLGAAVAQPATAQSVATNGTASTTVEPQRVTLDVTNAPLVQVVRDIAHQAGLLATYDDAVMPQATRVSLHVRGVTAEVAFQIALKGTGLVALVKPSGAVLVTRDNGVSMVLADVVSGVVTDAGSKRPVSGAVVLVDGAHPGVQTNEQGAFHLPNVAAGRHVVTVHRLGYQPYTTTIDVHDDVPVSLTIALVPVSTQLTEVVTTANGQQRRLEVGNVIAHLNVDSIVKTAPVASVTDLLSARAPGVQVIEANGAVGAGASIRIRGQSSLSMSSDPIVIVDGIRQDNRSGAVYSPLAGGTAAPSRINDIDINQIESIDILKGPAASTEYGTDAANGVIVITTKKGTSGPTLWHVTGERGWSNIPDGFPDTYYAFGHLTSDPTTQVHCTLTPIYGSPSVADSTCAIDSLAHDNPLNHKNTTIFGSGLRQSADIDVSGGAGPTRYFFGVGGSHELGTTQLPPAFRTEALAYGFTSGIFNPNTQDQRSARGNLTASLGHEIDLTFNTSYITTKQGGPTSTSPSTIYGSGPPVLDSANFYGYGSVYSSPLVSLGTQGNQNTTRATAGSTLDWRPASWFAGHLTTGVDHGSQANAAYEGAEVNGVESNGSYLQGRISSNNATTNIFSTDARGSATTQLRPSIRSITSLGLQMQRTTTNGVSVSASLTAPSVTQPTLNGAIDPQISQQSDGSATAGGYLEEEVGFNDRLFVTGALRLDGASGFGNDYNMSAYPKLSVSWLAFERNGNTVRLRGAFGASGVQPVNGASLQLYQPLSAYVGSSNVSVTQLTGPGNPNLKPERSQEWEGGVDVSLFENRVDLEFTGYSKNTKDALINDALGVTLGNLSQQENLGNVRNSGIEATIQATLIQTVPLNWNVTFNASHNTNKLIYLAPHVPGIAAGDNSSFQRFEVGYPLYGFWAKRATYADANGDGIIEADEVTVADTTSFMGSSLPKLEMSLSNQIGLFNGALSVGALLDAKAGDVIQNAAVSPSNGTLPEQNELGSPLWAQARDIAYLTNGTYTSLDFEKGWYVSFSELSLTYTPPASWLKQLRGRTLSLTLAARNLGIYTHYTGVDPRVSTSGQTQSTTDGSYHGNADLRVDQGAVPLARTWLLRVNVGL